MLLGFSVYALNRFGGVFTGTPIAGFARNHLNDLCGGFVFPACVNTFESLVGAPERYRFSGLPRIMGLALVCAFSWEVLAPLFMPTSTGDPLDALAYLAGAFLYHCICLQSVSDTHWSSKADKG